MRLRHQLAVYSPISARALAAAVGAGLPWSSDPRTALVELLRHEYSADGVLLCGSGTQALQVAIEVARRRLEPDAIVAVPAFSCFDVASAAIGAGGPVALYDLDPMTLSPDLTSLERVLVEGSQIVVVAPLYGIPIDWAATDRLVTSHGAVLIEDAAQGHGATHGAKPIGALGDISTLSFGRGKGWTGGSGGAAMLRGEQRRAQWPRLDPAPSVDLATMLRLDAQFALGRPATYGIPRSLPGLALGETVYHPPRRPASMSRVAASAVLATRSESLQEADRRRSAGEWLKSQVLSNRRLSAISKPGSPSGLPGFLRFPVLARKGLAGFADPAAAVRLGVAPSYPRRLGDLPELAPFLVNGGASFPGAARLVEELITFPAHSRITAADRKALTGLIEDYGGG